MANEKRLIDANVLLENIQKQYCNQCKAQGKDYKEILCRACDIDDMRISIEDAPTVDAVEVVRCKDCTEWDEAEQECKHWYGFRADDFCSYGERKDNEV